MEAKHTATPWTQVEGDRFSKEVVITTEDRIKNSMGSICEMDVHYTGQHGVEQSANAEFIVRACNAQADLVAALEDAHAMAIGWASHYMHHHQLDDVHPTHQGILDRAVAALAKAKAGA